MATAYMKGIVARIKNTFQTTEPAAEPRRHRRSRREEAQRQWHRRRRQRRDAEAEAERREGQQKQGGGGSGGDESGGRTEWAGRSRGGKRAESEFLDQSGRKRTSHYG